MAEPALEQTAVKRKSAVDEIEVDLSAPEPPSKRARRAIKKGKPLPPKPDSDDEKEDAAAERKEKKEKTRAEHSVWIGNLAFTLTAAEVRQWLVDNSGGVISPEAITRIKLPTVKEPGRDKKEKPANRGFAYVDFADIGDKVAAIALSETDLRGRRLLIKDATSFEGRPKKVESEDGPDGSAGPNGAMADADKDANASRKIFVGNMSFKTTEDDVRRNFEKCGEIEWVKVATFEDTGKCKGYGWVKFKEADAAAWAVKGFVKVKEQVETEEDFQPQKDSDDGANGDEQEPKERQFKTRKWWVNRMLGRELKLELAEDDQVRYKKRFGKDAKQRDQDGASTGVKDRARGPRGLDEGRRPGGDAVRERPAADAVDLQVARLTGAAVKATGTKVTFD